MATIDDTVVESAETLTVTLSGATAGAAISTAQGIGTINDNDTASPPSFAIASTSATEGGALVFTVSKTGSTTGSFSVSFATSDGTAQAGSDYVATSGTISFSPAEASKTFSVSSIDDTAIEGDESFTATLSSATGGATITTSAVTGTIVDNDSGPTICRDERGTIIPCEQPLTARKAGA